MWCLYTYLLVHFSTQANRKLRFVVCYLLISTLSDVLQLSVKLDSSPISHHWKCAGSKKEQFNWRTPPLYSNVRLLDQTNANSPNVTPWGATLRYGMTLPVFFVLWVVEKCPQNRSIAIVKHCENHLQPWTWPEKVTNSSISPFPQSP